MGMETGKLQLIPTPPTDRDDNIRWRTELIEHAATSGDFQNLVMTMCREDICGWFDGFVWTYDPRQDISPRPMILYPYQRDVVLDLQAAIRGGEDRLIEKSRDMGATWLVIGVFVHFWTFIADTPFLISSRVEDLVDRRGDPDCLMWKADYLVEGLPAWMRPAYSRTFMHLSNRANGSVIDGAAANQVGRGGRRKAIMLDEAAQMVRGIDASTADCTPCRIFVSTPHGVGNEFAEIRRAGTATVITLHWTKHPVKAAGKRRLPDGKWTSPWYEYECSRRASPRDIAQELDIDYLASGDMFFDLNVLSRIQSDDVRPPALRGNLRVERDGQRRPKKIEFAEQPNGPLRLWLHLDDEHRPPVVHNYAVGCDVSNGLGASNSVASIVDVHTGEKVGEYATAERAPEDFAEFVDALGRWFGGQIGRAYVAWEANGPGLVFGKRLLGLGYGYVHWQQQEESQSPKRSRIPGWHSNRNSKELILGEYRAALAKREFVNHSAEAIREATEYIYYPSGGIGPSQLVEETGAARQTHGDRVIADAVVNRARVEQPKARPPEKVVSPWSFAGRRQEYERKRKRERGVRA